MEMYHMLHMQQQQQQQQHSLFSQASWGRLEMKPEKNNALNKSRKMKIIVGLVLKYSLSEMAFHVK